MAKQMTGVILRNVLSAAVLAQASYVICL